MSKKTTIDIPDAELKAHIKFYTAKVKKLEATLQQNKTILETLTERYSKLNTSDIITTPAPYNAEWVLGKKAQYALSTTKRIMTTKSLYGFITVSDYARGVTYPDKRKLIVKLSATLNSYISKDAVFTKVKFAGDNTVYFALREWYVNGKLPKKYLGYVD
jgi:AAA15 family ATPase/GTPase